jgi:hypothetical protein
VVAAPIAASSSQARELFGYAGLVLSRHWIAGRDRVLQHANQSEEFVAIVAVGPA